LIRAMRLIWCTGVPLINRIARILHAKRSYISASHVTRDERCRRDPNEDSVLPDQREIDTAAMIMKDLVLIAVLDPP
jgi:hypothetical protein